MAILRESVTTRRKRSICLSCGGQIRNEDLVPIISYMRLAGRCRGCKSKISPQYPLVELSLSLFFALVFYYAFKIEVPALAIAEGLFLLAIGSLLLVIFVYDLRHKIIPDWAAALLATTAFLRIVVWHFLLDDLGSLPFYLDVLSGLLAALPFYFLWLVSGGRWMGLGDAKLMVGLGMLLGFRYFVSGIIISFWLAAASIVALMLAGKILRKFGFFRSLSLTRKSEVPLGPFLIAGSLLVFFLKFDLTSLF